MLRKTDLRALAESVGLAPSLADAEAAATKRREALTAAQGAVEAARVSLDAAHDAGAPAAEISRLEASLADANITAGRAQLSAAAAERRLNASKEAHTEKAKAAARAALAKATGSYDKAAAEIDRLAEQIAVQVDIVNKQYEQFNIARTAGCAGLYMPVTGATLATLAIEHAIAAQAGEWTENRPSASEAAARVTGAVLAVAA